MHAEIQFYQLVRVMLALIVIGGCRNSQDVVSVQNKGNAKGAAVTNVRNNEW